MRKNGVIIAKEGVTAAFQKLAYFRPSPSVRTAISCDALPLGLGAMLWQQNGREQWLPVAAASRSLTGAESRYSQLEREMLAVVFAITRFRQYVLGRPVQVFTDHKPLVAIIHKPFDNIPSRLQRWLVSLMPYQLLTYKPGCQLVCADTLSRAPLPEQDTTPEESRSVGEYASMVLEEAPVDSAEIQRVSDEDVLIKAIKKRVIMNAWRDRSAAEEPYYLAREQLTVVEGVLLLGNRYAIPEALRRQILQLAHEEHPGIDAYRDTLRKRVWWPGLTKDTKLFEERCDICWRRRPNSDQNLQPSELEAVWNKLAVCFHRRSYSFVHHRLWVSLPRGASLRLTTATGVIEKLMEVFSRFGLPSMLVSDNGPQFVATEMELFLEKLGIQHIKASPRYPQSKRHGRAAAPYLTGAITGTTTFYSFCLPIATSSNGHKELNKQNVGIHTGGSLVWSNSQHSSAII